jgi:elongator complex protein 2
MAQAEAYLAAGANRHPAVADWDESQVLAFGCDRNIALWHPNVRP